MPLRPPASATSLAVPTLPEAAENTQLRGRNCARAPALRVRPGSAHAQRRHRRQGCPAPALRTPLLFRTPVPLPGAQAAAATVCALACSSPPATMAARTRGAALRLCAIGTGLAGVVRGEGGPRGLSPDGVGPGPAAECPPGEPSPRLLPPTRGAQGQGLAREGCVFLRSALILGRQEVSGALAPLGGVKDAAFPRCSHSELWL